jgi:hypothetical protein
MTAAAVPLPLANFDEPWVKWVAIAAPLTILLSAVILYGFLIR